MVSVIIPTLQKDRANLDLLVQTLADDAAVSEILLIDNSCQGYMASSEKVRVILPERNLFVNPSLNLGVREAKNDLFEYFNDDVLVCENFCSKVQQLISREHSFGSLIMAMTSIVNTKRLALPSETDFRVVPVEALPDKYAGQVYSCIMFSRKKIWKDIPEHIKVLCGDDFIIQNCRENGYGVFSLHDAIVFHLGSLSTSNPKLHKIVVADILAYAKINKLFKNNPAYKHANRGRLTRFVRGIKGLLGIGSGE